MNTASLYVKHTPRPHSIELPNYIIKPGPSKELKAQIHPNAGQARSWSRLAQPMNTSRSWMRGNKREITPDHGMGHGYLQFSENGIITESRKTSPVPYFSRVVSQLTWKKKHLVGAVTNGFILIYHLSMLSNRPVYLIYNY